MTFGFLHLISGSRTDHIWDNSINDTVCRSWEFLQKRGEHCVTNTPIANVCNNCTTILERKFGKKPQGKKNKKPKMAPIRPEEEAYLKRWNGVKNQHPSLWEKMDNDPAYERAVMGRGLSDDGSGTTMGTKWGIGQPRGPN